MKIERKAKTKEKKYIWTKEEGRRDHRRDGLPAEGYEGARQGHIFPWHHVRWWLTTASLGRRVSLERKIVLKHEKKKWGKTWKMTGEKKYTYLRKTHNRHKTQKSEKWQKNINLRKTHKNTHNWENMILHLKDRMGCLALSRAARSCPCTSEKGPYFRYFSSQHLIEM